MRRGYLILLALACQGPPGPNSAGGPEPPVSADLAVVRVARWPAAGTELTVRIDTGPGRRDLSRAIRLVQSENEALNWIARPVALAPGYTALLVLPAPDANEREAQVRATAAILAARPAEERLALFRWGAAVDQVVGFTSDRALLERGISVALEPDDETPIAPEEAARIAATEVQRIGGAGPRVMRAVIALGEGAADSGRDVTHTPILEVSGDQLIDSARAASATIDRLAIEAHYTVAVCAADRAGAVLSVDGLDGTLDITWPEPWPESLGGTCDPAVIAGTRQSVPSVFELLFTAEQRAVYEERVANLSKAEFALSVRLDSAQEPISATAHLRGKGTLDCERKSYTVTLNGPGRHIFPDTYADEFYLIAMCADDRYIQLFTSNQLLADAGLFALRYRFVEVIVDGAERGVYLLVEKADDALVRGNSRVSAVLRRRFAPPDDRIEVEKSTGDPEAAATAWNDFQDRLGGLAGDELLAAAADRIDLDRYLTWIALMTALQNGDYVDEVWMTATDARGLDGEVREHWRFTGWDSDDLFSPCHFAGTHSMVDPNQLLYCVEGNIDEILLADPVVYARYTERMADLLRQLTPERMQEALDRTGAALLPYFQRPEICQAMTELLAANPGAVDPAEAQRDIREHLDLLREEYEDRRALLRSRLDALPQ